MHHHNEIIYSFLPFEEKNKNMNKHIISTGDMLTLMFCFALATIQLLLCLRKDSDIFYFDLYLVCQDETNLLTLGYFAIKLNSFVQNCTTVT